MPPRPLRLLTILLLVNFRIHIEDRQYVRVADHEDVVIYEELREQLDAILVWIEQRLCHLDLGLAQRHLVGVEYEDLVFLGDEE